MVYMEHSTRIPAQQPPYPAGLHYPEARGFYRGVGGTSGGPGKGGGGRLLYSSSAKPIIGVFSCDGLLEVSKTERSQSGCITPAVLESSRWGRGGPKVSDK